MAAATLDHPTLQPFTAPKWLAAASKRAAKAIAELCQANGRQEALARLMDPARLPWKPGSASEKDGYRQQFWLHNAVHDPYIELNSAAGIDWLVFDVDVARKDGTCADAWSDAGLPPPNIVILNRSNGHAQHLYALETRVCTGPGARVEPQRYLEDLRTEYAWRMNADMAFAGCRSKNPLHANWHTTVLREAPYSLGELAEYKQADGLRLARKARGRKREVRQCGRNVELFDRLRFWAYAAKAEFVSSTLTAFQGSCMSQANRFNLRFGAPLGEREVHHVVKSVATWVWRRYSRTSGSKEDISAMQSRVATMKGKKERDIGLEMLQCGATVAEVMAATGVCRSTVHNWSKRLVAATSEVEHDIADEADQHELSTAEEKNEPVQMPSGLSPAGLAPGKAQGFPGGSTSESSASRAAKKTNGSATEGRAPLAGLRDLGLRVALEALGVHYKVDSTFKPLKIPCTERLYASTSQADFELIITGRVFFDTRAGKGGRGAIDLAMHVLGLSCSGAVKLLQLAVRSTSSPPPAW